MDHLGVLSEGHLAVLRLGSRNLGPSLVGGYRCPSSQAPIQMDTFWFQARRSLGGLAFSLSQLEDHRAAWDSYFHTLRLPKRLVRMRGLVWNWGGGRQRQGAHACPVSGETLLDGPTLPALLPPETVSGCPCSLCSLPHLTRNTIHSRSWAVTWRKRQSVHSSGLRTQGHEVRAQKKKKGNRSPSSAHSHSPTFPFPQHEPGSARERLVARLVGARRAFLAQERLAQAHILVI